MLDLSGRSPRRNRGWRRDPPPFELSGAGLPLALLVVASPLVAQTVPVPPTSQDIDRAPPPARTGALTLAVRGGPAEPACPLAAPALAGATITLRGARFHGLRGLPDEALRPAFDDLVGRTIPLSALCAIRDAAATILNRAGYIAALTVPEQRSDDGIVTFDVVMARLVRIEVRGRSGSVEHRLAAYLRKLADEPLFDRRRAEHYLLLARDLPGTTVSLALEPAPGGRPGDVIGILTARREPMVIEANVQNEGSKPVGRWGGLVTAAWNDPTGAGDRLTLGLFANVPPREQTVVQGGYERRIGGEGLTIAGRMTYARTRPAVGGGDPYRSHTVVGTLEAAYPLRRSVGFDLGVRGGIDLVDQDLRAAGTTLTRDRERVAYAAVDLAAADRPEAGDPRWRTSATLDVRQGIGILGSSRGCTRDGETLICPTPLPSRLPADATATIVRVSGVAEWRVRPRFTVAAAPRLQYGFSPLISYEQYSGGAYTIGRGYDPGAVTGDSGAGTSLEVRYDAVPAKGRTPSIQPYGFVDGAWVWNRDAQPGEHYPQRILSAGGGVRAALGDRLRFDLGAATPLRRAPDQVVRGDTRVLVTVTTRLLPWSAR